MDDLVQKCYPNVCPTADLIQKCLVSLSPITAFVHFTFCIYLTVCISWLCVCDSLSINLLKCVWRYSPFLSLSLSITKFKLKIISHSRFLAWPFRQLKFVFAVFFGSSSVFRFELISSRSVFVFLSSFFCLRYQAHKSILPWGIQELISHQQRLSLWTNMLFLRCNFFSSFSPKSQAKLKLTHFSLN